MQINKEAQNTLSIKGKLQNKMQTWFHYMPTYKCLKEYPLSMTATPVTSARRQEAQETVVFYTGIVRFLNCALSQVAFTKRPTSVPVFADQKKSADDFGVYGKGKKQKQHSLFVWQWGGWRPHSLKQGARRPPAPSQELHSAPQHPDARASNCICEHMCFTSFILRIRWQDVF